ncbi:YeeE/YedE thiosulfate transporter family protein [Polynucleobacter sp. MWH-UH2A]|uniref:YeeE/YedE thiosulfate transporter family protein n=1 Tax=Polynucleobacter sp. MWH-UH2A TaxID=1855617 RepID=UPI001BFCE4E6|nr:YeeE/YedE thiosulfate transporter family protein [Polynucleobacter sp. MWH-UH2A]QWD64693.1 YeeE/YedE family protein [Polynucleobacter sp. MWH-UH2A]
MSEILSGLLLGMGFGFVLERAGFGNPNKLTGQFRLSDWSVFKVMFTAIVFASVGLFLLEKIGLVDAGNLFVPPAFLGAAAIGGALVGAGFAIGGYCPGTSVVGFMSGRIDAAIFLIGLLLGTVLFAGIYPGIEFLTTFGEYSKADSLPDALNVSALSVDVVMVIAAIGVFILGSWMEKKCKSSGCGTSV